jgi:hypothetical protein
VVDITIKMKLKVYIVKNLKETIEYWCHEEHKLDKTIEIIK